MALLDTAPRSALSPRAPALSMFAPGALFARFEAWRMRRATVRALMQLTDKELDDIGLTRGDIDRMFR